MHTVFLSLIAMLPFLTDCSAYIAKAGKDLRTFETRDQVRAQFGRPTETGTSVGQEYEEFRTHRKIADEHESDTLELMSAWTHRTSELIMVPIELALTAAQTVSGRDVRFWFDSSGRVIAVFLDGRQLQPTATTPPNRNDLIDQSVDGQPSPRP